jgi:hypothetical protein
MFTALYYPHVTMSTDLVKNALFLSKVASANNCQRDLERPRMASLRG